jgi:hypothetical protein
MAGLVVVVLATMGIVFLLDRISKTDAVAFALMLLPTCFALSFAYARSETTAPPRRPLLGRSSGRIVGAGLALGAAILAVGVQRSSVISTRTKPAADTVALSSTVVHSWPIDWIPTRVAFSIPKNAADSATPGTPSTYSEQKVRGLVSGDDPSTDSLAIEVFDSTGLKQVDYSANPPQFELDLRAGKYVVEIASAGETGFGEELIHRVKRSFGLEVPLTPKYGFAVQIVTPALVSVLDSVRKASDFAVQIYRLTRTPQPDWAAAQKAADSSLRLMAFVLRRDSLVSASPGELNRVCWWTTLAGRARDALPICEIGVARTPGDEMVRDIRGFARALVGDRNGAIADFAFFKKKMLQSTDSTRQRWGRVRTAWIDRLKRGEMLDLAQVREDTK